MTDENNSVNEVEPFKGWQPGNALPNADKARIDPNKFEKYSMDPTNPSGGGKPEAFRQLGYDVDTAEGRAAGAENVIGQLKAQLAHAGAVFEGATAYGNRYRVDVTITGPNGAAGTLITIWQYDEGADFPRLITDWLEVYK